MNKIALPKDFPVGRLRLTQALSSSFRTRGYGRTMPPLLARYGGAAPRWKPGSSIADARETISSREGGTLRQFVAAKSKPSDIRTAHPPMSPEHLPAISEAHVEQSTAVRRDADVAKAAAAEKIATEPASAALLGAIGASAGFMTSMALQKGMNIIREMIWKHMTPADKARLLLRKAKQMVTG